LQIIYKPTATEIPTTWNKRIVAEQYEIQKNTKTWEVKIPNYQANNIDRKSTENTNKK
jgi:hypothetical protein